MSLVKTVELKILADAADAHRQLDEVTAEAGKLDGNAIRMRFRVDGAEGKAQLDEIRAEADRLGFKDVSIKVRVDGAGRAIADLMAVKHEEDKVRDQGLMNRIGGLVGGAGGGIPGAVGPLPLPAVAAAIPLVGALATEVTAVAAGFAAAGAGAGAFALLAMPAVKQVEAAYQGLNKAQAKYQAALDLEKLDPTKAHKAAVKSALDQLNLAGMAIGKLPADEQKAVDGLYKLHSEFGKMSAAFRPQAFKIFADGLKVVGNLMPHLTPFANTFATGLDKLLQQAGKFTQSKGFSDWLKQFHSLEGPAIGAIGHGIGEVANAFGKLMTTFSGKDVAHAINIAFGAISGTISVAGSAIHRFAQNFDGMKSAATTAVHAVGAAFSSLAGTVSGAVRGVISAWMAMVRGIERGVSDAVHAASQLPGRIRGLFSGAAGWLVSAGRNVVMGLVHGIESMVGAVAGAIGHIASTIRSFLPFSPARQGPLSGQGSPDIAGARIAAMLVSGMDAGMAGVARSAGRLAGAASVTPAMARGAAGGGDVHVHFHGVFTGDKYGTAQQVHQLLVDFKRNRGRAPLGLG